MSATTSPALPDLNAETYPFEVVQFLLDQAAHLHFFSIPLSTGSAAISGTGTTGGVIGIRISETLHRFRIGVEVPAGSGMHVRNETGEPLARFDQRWMFIPDQFGALPSLEPSPVRFDPSVSQRFVMLDAICKFENGRDGFRGFGTCQTFPGSYGGKPEILAGAVGNITEGFGKFRGLEGTYTYCGTLSADSGFRGSVLCRVVDPGGILQSGVDLPDLQQVSFPAQDASYLTFRGQKKDRTQKTQYMFGSDGQVDGLQLEPQIRLFNFDCAIDGRGELRSASSVGKVVGTMPSYIFFNVLNPGAPGTADAPISFHDYDQYIFSDRDGGTLGSFGFDGGGGRALGLTTEQGGGGQTFNLRLQGAPGQKALRFGGFGPVVNAKGQFDWFRGLVAHNSVVGIAPHALSTAFIARISDPSGRLSGRTTGAPPDAKIVKAGGETLDVYLRKRL